MKSNPKETTMRFFYTDANGERKGPIGVRALRVLATQKRIQPTTPLETDGGHKGLAGQIPDLFSAIPGILPSIDENPFTLPEPIEEKPVTVPMPIEERPVTVPVPPPIEYPSAPQCINLENKRSSRLSLVGLFKITLTILILLVAAVLGGPIFRESYKLNAASKGVVVQDTDIVDKPVKVNNVSFAWGNKPTAFSAVRSFWTGTVDASDKTESYACGTFTVKAKLNESLYELVSTEEALKELGITQNHEKEFDHARSKYQDLPDSYKNGLSDPTLSKDLSDFRFCKLIAPKGKYVTLTGRIAVSKDEKNTWQAVEKIQVDPLFEDKYLKESQLQDICVLHTPGTTEFHPATLSAVKTAIQSREDFMVKVDNAYDVWKFTEAQNEYFGKAILGKPLDIVDASVDWTTRSPGVASGRYTLKAQTTEKLYRSVSRRKALDQMDVVKRHETEVEKFGVSKIFENELYEGNLFNESVFYELSLPSGTQIALTGNIKLTKSGNGPWKSSEIEVDSINPSLDDLTRASRIENRYKLDSPVTRNTADSTIQRFATWLTKLVKQKDDFDKFCKGKTYKGTFKAKGAFDAVFFDVLIVFDNESVKGENRGTGTIEIPSRGWRGKRPFSVVLDPEKLAEFPVTGLVSNESLPTQDAFLKRADSSINSRAEFNSAKRFYSFLDDNVKIDIRFSDKEMQFYLSNRNGENRVRLSLSEVLSDDDPEDKQLSSPNRDWVLKAIEKYQPQ